MDPITHILTGNLLNYSFQKNTDTQLIRKRFFFTALIASIAPDLDYFFRIFGKLTYLKYHRGPTHSFLFAFLIFAIAYKFYYSKLEESATSVKLRNYLLFCSCYLFHIFLDILTSFGTIIFWPFSNYRATLDVLAIIDLPIIIISLLGIILAKNKLFFNFRKKIGNITIIIIIGYCFFIKYTSQKEISEINNIINPTIQNQNLQIISLPSILFSRIRNNIIIEDNNFQTIDRSNNRFITTIYPKFDVSTINQNPEFTEFYYTDVFEFIQWFLRFTVYEIEETVKDKKLIIYDLRYRYMANLDLKNKIFTFSIVYNKQTKTLAYFFENQEISKDNL